MSDLLKLKFVQDELNKKIVNQQEGVQALTTVIYKHYLKIYGIDMGCFFTAPLSLLLHGDTGCGKTFLVKTTAELLNLPFIEVNCKSLSQEGWSGRPFVEVIKEGLVEQGHPRGGIIFLDEFDKLCHSNTSSGGDNVNYHIQTSILKYVEGMIFTDSRGNSINFNNWIFVFAGAFVGLKLNDGIKIGFNNKDSSNKVLPTALIDYGLLPELAGRINNYAKIRTLDYNDYILILRHPESTLNLWTTMLKKLDIQVEIDYSKEKEMIDKAVDLKLGARGLLQEVEHYITSIINENIDKIDLNKFSPLYCPKV